VDFWEEARQSAAIPLPQCAGPAQQIFYAAFGGGLTLSSGAYKYIQQFAQPHHRIKTKGMPLKV